MLLCCCTCSSGLPAATATYPAAADNAAADNAAAAGDAEAADDATDSADVCVAAAVRGAAATVHPGCSPHVYANAAARAHVRLLSL